MSAKSKEDLVSQGFTEFTIEDFHNTVSLAVSGWAGREGGSVGCGKGSLSSLTFPHLTFVPGWGSSWTLSSRWRSRPR